MKMSGHVPNAMTDGVLGDLHPDLDKGITELLDSLSCSLDQAWELQASRLKRTTCSRRWQQFTSGRKT